MYHRGIDLARLSGRDRRYACHGDRRGARVVAVARPNSRGRRMSAFRPTTNQERWLAALRHLADAPRRDAALRNARSGGWTRSTSLKRVALFVLGCVTSGLTFAFFEDMHVAGSTWVPALLLLAAGEWLILRRKLFACGIEEALDAAGIVGLMLTLKVTSSDLGACVALAAAFALAGFRLLNPLFATLSAIAAAIAIALASHPGLNAYSAALAPANAAPSYFCFAVAGIALALSTRVIRRPAYDRMLGWLVIAMPLTGYTALSDFGNAAHSLRWTALLPLLFGCVALAVGVRRRLHAPLLSFILCMACGAYELRDLSPVSLQTRLLVGGSLVLLLGIALERWLRTPRHGVTSQPVDDGETALELAQMAGAATISPQPQEAGAGRFKGDGGGFSGGGASGTY